MAVFRQELAEGIVSACLKPAAIAIPQLGRYHVSWVAAFMGASEALPAPL
jgi:hypothetical protein